MNQPLVCRLRGLAGPRPAPFALGMTSGWVCPRCSGGGDTLETLLRFVRVRRAGPPLVLGGFAGSMPPLVGGARERDRLLENSAPVPLAETGEGVWRWPLALGMWKSGLVPRLEKEERLDMCEEKEEGSAPEKGLVPLVVGEEGLLEGGS